MRNLVFLGIVLSFNLAHAGYFDEINKEVNFFLKTPSILENMKARLPDKITTKGLEENENILYEAINTDYQKFCVERTVPSSRLGDCRKISDQLDNYSSAKFVLISNLEASEKEKQRIKDDAEMAASDKAEEESKIHESAKEEAYQNSPQRLKDDYCDELENIKENRSEIVHEKEVTRRSGIINQTAMYSLTKSIMNSETETKKLLADYRKSTGKNLSPTDCKQRN